MNREIDDISMALISQYYDQARMYSPVFLPEPDIVVVGAESSKSGERRKKNKSDCDIMMRKRKLSKEQVKMLELSFKEEQKLESERKYKLAAELGLDPRQVAVWFQNRRVRWKSKKLEDEYLKLKSEHDNTVVQKCHLETELLKLKEQLIEAEKVKQKLSERSDGFSSRSNIGEFGLEGLKSVFYAPENNYVHGLGWDSNFYYI